MPSAYSLFPEPQRSALTTGLTDPLASNFSILLGRKEITVPNVPSADNYQLVCAYPRRPPVLLDR